MSHPIPDCGDQLRRFRRIDWNSMDLRTYCAPRSRPVSTLILEGLGRALCSHICSRTAHHYPDGAAQNSTSRTGDRGHIRRSQAFWLVRRHIRERPPVRLLIRRAGFETLAAHAAKRISIVMTVY